MDLPNDDGDYSDPNVLNLLEMENPDQINIEAEVIEISSDDAIRVSPMSMPRWRH